jgi:cation diffusion facilitator family transporter
LAQERYEQIKRSERGAIVSIIAYLSLSLLKLTIGYFAFSQALWADGWNNVSDIVASLAVLIGLRFSQKPADDDHPYGHWKAETVASLVASFLMMSVGIQVCYTGIVEVTKPKTIPSLLAAGVGVCCAIVMFFVYRYNKRLAEETNSQAVMAAAKDNLSDALVSIGAVIGIVGSQFQLIWLDSVTAIIVGVLICKTAWEVFYKATHTLMDGYDETLIAIYKETVLSVDGVLDVRNIRARKYGNNSVVDVVLCVDSKLAIADAHNISTEVERELMKTHHVYDVHVHIEPNENT